MSAKDPIAWEFAGLDGEPFLMVKGYPSGCCYQLFEWRNGKKGSAEAVDWYPMDCYPWTLRSAVDKVRELMLARLGGTTKDAETMAARLQAMERNLARAISQTEKRLQP